MSEAEMKQKLAELEYKLDLIVLKHEASIRYMVETKAITYDDYLLSISFFQQYILKLQELNKVDSIIERLDKAEKYNSETTDYKIYADDLNLLQQIKKFGEVSNKTANRILQLPHTSQFKAALLELVDKPADSPSSN